MAGWYHLIGHIDACIHGVLVGGIYMIQLAGTPILVRLWNDQSPKKLWVCPAEAIYHTMIWWSGPIGNKHRIYMGYCQGNWYNLANQYNLTGEVGPCTYSTGWGDLYYTAGRSLMYRSYKVLYIEYWLDRFILYSWLVLYVHELTWSVHMVPADHFMYIQCWPAV